MEQQAESTDKKLKTSKSRRETAVQGTNDNSIVSKCSMSAAGYFNDNFLKKFVAKVSKRAPLINRGYYLRAVCIDQVLRQFLSKDQGVKKQIVSLGAGFDSSYFRLKAEGLLKDAGFYEIDFPEVTKRKNAIIQSNAELKNLLSLDDLGQKVVPPIELSTPDYNLLGVDLTQLNTLEAALRMCGADFDTPTLLLSECVMTYMTRRCSSALVKWAGETFQDALFVMFEQINPDDAFGLFMQNHFHTIGSPLKCITSFPTLETQIKRFLNLGWEKCRCHDLNELYRHTLSAEERARIETLDPFDEYEEFNLKCAHYFLLVASTESSIDDYLVTGAGARDDSNQPSPKEGCITLANFPPPHSLNIKRFSHTSVLMHDRFIVTTGGFGEVDGRHQRVQEVSVTDTVTMETKLVRCHSDSIQYSRMHHSAVVLSDGRLMLFGGRQSPFFLCSQSLLVHLQIDVDSLDMAERLSFLGDLEENAVSWNGERNPEKNTGFQNSNGDDMNSENTNYGGKNARNTNNRGGGTATNSVRESGDTFRNSGERRNVDDGRNCVKQNENSDSKIAGDDRTNSADMGETNSASDEKGRNLSASANNFKVCDSLASFPVLKQNILSRNNSNSTGSSCEAKKPFAENEMRRNCNLAEFPIVREETTTFEWGQVTCSVYKQSGDIPCPRWRHATTLVNVKGEENIFLHGGRTQKAEVLGDAFLLDVKTGDWKKLECKGEGPGALHSHTVVTWEGWGSQHVVVVGGMDGDQCPQNAVHILELATLTWRCLSVTGGLLPRYSHTCHVIGERLIVVGGINLQRNTPGLAVVNLQTGHAEEYAFPPVMKNQLLMYHRHCSVLLPDGHLVVLGGGGNCFSFGTHLNSTPVVMNISKCLDPSTA